MVPTAAERVLILVAARPRTHEGYPTLWHKTPCKRLLLLAMSACHAHGEELKVCVPLLFVVQLSAAQLLRR